MWQRKLNRLSQIISIVKNKLIRIAYKLRVIQLPKFRSPLIISPGVLAIAAIIALSIIGLFNYKPDTSPSFPYIPPPLGERQNYYFESSVNTLWYTFFSPYGDMEFARIKYLGQSFIFKNFLLKDYILEGKIHETYFIFNGIKFVPSDPSELHKLKAGNAIDIIGFCASLDERNQYVYMVNCQFLPAGLALLPLPGGSVFVSGY